jgi:hypothetical protein
MKGCTLAFQRIHLKPLNALNEDQRLLADIGKLQKDITMPAK